MADGVLSGAREARDTVEAYGRRGARRLHDTADEVGRRGADVRGELSHLWDQLEALVEKRAIPAASEAAHRTGVYAREGRDMAVDMAGRLGDATRARPLVAIGVAVAATWLIASMLRSKR